MVPINIAVLVKEVADPEGTYGLDDTGAILTAGLPQIPSLFDDHALEAAVQLKESCGARVTALSLGPVTAEKTLRHCLAMGAEEAILVVDSNRAWDSHGAARLLAAALGTLGDLDLILCGREAADTGSGMVGPYIAMSLSIPFLSLITGIERTDRGFRVRRPWEGGEDLFECQTPVLLTVCAEANTPRYPSFLRMLEAKKKQIRRLLPDEPALVPGPSLPPQLGLIRRFLPDTGVTCDFVAGGSAGDLADGLLAKLRQERVI